jgi:hypothetical protein
MTVLETKTPAALRWIHIGIAVALSAFILFAHGCHGDEDTELFGRLLPRDFHGKRLLEHADGG